jgi:hypothetical protein
MVYTIRIVENIADNNLFKFLLLSYDNFKYVNLTNCKTNTLLMYYIS